MTEKATKGPQPPSRIVRFSRGELNQHWVLMITLTVLALTGIGLLFHDTWLGRALIAMEGGVESRGTIHRVFAVVLMALVAWHFLHILFSDRGHRQLMDMRPRWRDVTDVVALLGYYLGLRDASPEFGRFTPMQKLQYWGAGIGSLMMIATGLALWFHTQTMTVAPKWLIDVITIVHGYEGLILFILLFGWHLYIVHLSPGNFPLQRTFLTGTISSERMWREHRAEYRAVFGDTPPRGSEHEETE